MCPCHIKDQTSNPRMDAAGSRTSIRGLEQPDRKSQAEASRIAAGKQKLSLIERMFHDYYAPALDYSIGPKICFNLTFKPVSMLLIAIFGGLAIFFASAATTLSTPDDAPVWFPDDHMTTGQPQILRNDFLAGADDNYMEGSLYFGIAGVYAPDFSRWTPGEDRGTVVWDDNFNITVPAAQTALIQLCNDLEVELCDPVGEPGAAHMPICARAPHNLLSSGSLKCHLREWQTELGGTLPTGLGFYAEFYNWLQTTNGREYRDDFGWVNGTIKSMRLRFQWSAVVGLPVSDLRLVHDRSYQFLTTSYANPPTALGLPFFYYGLFSWMETTEDLVSTLLTGIYQALVFILILLFVTTGSILASFYSTLTVGSITISLLGMIRAVYNFQLGIPESIAGVMVIGLSIDYTIHLLIAYMHSHGTTRGEKMTDAATTMGITVLGGALTTFVGALFMLPCQLTFFTQMCILLSTTIGLSIVFALLFFMPVIAMFGPEGEQMPLHQRIAACFCPAPQDPWKEDKAQVASTTVAES